MSIGAIMTGAIRRGVELRARVTRRAMHTVANAVVWAVGSCRNLPINRSARLGKLRDVFGEFFDVW